MRESGKTSVSPACQPAVEQQIDGEHTKATWVFILDVSYPYPGGALVETYQRKWEFYTKRGKL
jgi:hypothetical protein